LGGGKKHSLLRGEREKKMMRLILSRLQGEGQSTSRNSSASTNSHITRKENRNLREREKTSADLNLYLSTGGSSLWKCTSRIRRGESGNFIGGTPPRVVLDVFKKNEERDSRGERKKTRRSNASKKGREEENRRVPMTGGSRPCFIREISRARVK